MMLVWDISLVDFIKFISHINMLTLKGTALSSGTYLNWVIENTPTAWWHDSADPVELQLGLDSGAIGVTTNPYLSSVALAKHRAAGAKDVDSVLARNLNSEQKAEELMRQVVVRAAAMSRPHHDRSGGKNGYVCAQVNPSRAGERDSMLAMARRFHAWAPNIAVKLPAVSAGLDVLEDCIAEGITATATVSFTVPQVIAIAERCRAGRHRAKRNGIKPGECFSVLMIGRLDDYLREVALDNRSPVNESNIRQAGLAVTKRAYSIYRERGYEAVLLVAALRGSYHLTELAGAELLMSIAPSAQEWFISRDHPREERIEKGVASDVIQRLYAMREFVKAYEPDGMAPKDFISYGVSQRTLCQFIEAGWKLLEGFK
jgi:transaldolase